MSLAFVPCSHIFCVGNQFSLLKILPTPKKCGRIKSVSEIKFTNKDVTRTKNMRRNFFLTYSLLMNSIITAPSDALHVQQIPELDNELPENCIFNKGKTGCGATTLAIENRISTLIAVPTVNLIKNKLPEHADLLGVYGGVTNQEIADYLKTHDR